MVGIFSRFSSTRNGHRRTQSSLDDRSGLPPTIDGGDASAVAGAAFAVGHGIEVEIEFKPIEHPIEPLDYDQPIQCPLPEPSILNDGRIWKERVCAGERRTESSVAQEGTQTKQDSAETKQISPRSSRSRSDRLILPSVSAPEHNIVKLLEECNSSTSI
ncbi:Inter-alpha-trypsin inhibitor heavy chain like [Heracleum sosnowskyi]|uniref:Inter-alpha-trypsin inhibitor heavy chain like n=1 Tax=Heracleum sosnowskyi TaxID=360622 RepID=A0AAD8HYE4_9APIA|nr:Inter-alpha-trypsin inhibitor heavy chain like [Heracleum sosnowskyi]